MENQLLLTRIGEPKFANKPEWNQPNPGYDFIKTKGNRRVEEEMLGTWKTTLWSPKISNQNLGIRKQNCLILARTGTLETKIRLVRQRENALPWRPKGHIWELATDHHRPMEKEHWDSTKQHRQRGTKTQGNAQQPIQGERRCKEHNPSVRVDNDGPLELEQRVGKYQQLLEVRVGEVCKVSWGQKQGNWSVEKPAFLFGNHHFVVLIRWGRFEKVEGDSWQ